MDKTAAGSGTPTTYRVTKVFNNSILGAVSSVGERVILTGRGIGWGLKAGTLLGADGVETVYVLEDDRAARRAERTLEGLDDEVLDVAREIVAEAARRLPLRSPGALLLPVADHVSFLRERAAQDLVMDFPLEWDVRQAYPEEVAVGALAVKIIERRLGVRAQSGEDTAFAMHFVASQMRGRDIGQVAVATSLIHDLLTVSARAAIPCDRSRAACDQEPDARSLDPTSLPVRRFITHVRFLIARLDQRVAAGQQPEQPGTETGDPLTEVITQHVPDRARTVAQEMAALVESRLGVRLSTQERAYLVLHTHLILAQAELAPVQD